MDMSLTELEDAINYWRALHPSTGEEQALSREVNALAGIYAMMIVTHRKFLALEALDELSRELLLGWRAAQSASHG